MKALVVTVIVIAVVAAAIYGNMKYQDSKFNKKCISAGGSVSKSGTVCDLTNCDKSKYPCTFID